MDTAESSSCPQSPLSFHVENAVGHNGLLVAWQPPPMDGMCRSNGCLVTGYQLYVNGGTKALVSGAMQSRVGSVLCSRKDHFTNDLFHLQTILSGLTLTKSLRLGISTSSVEGKSSKVMEIVYNSRPISVRQTSMKLVDFHTLTPLQISRTSPEPEVYRTVSHKS